MNRSLIVSKLKNYVKSKNLISNQRDLEKYNKDWRGFYNFNSICAIFPETVEEIQKILYFAIIIILRSYLKPETLALQALLFHHNMIMK